MKAGCVLRVAFLLALVLPWASAAAEEPDAPGSRDHKMFARIPGFFIDRFDREEEGAYTFPTEGGPRRVSGRTYQIDYRLKTGADRPEVHQVVSNHLAAVQALGGEVLSAEDASATFRIEEETTEIWVRLTARHGGAYSLRIVEKVAGPSPESRDPGIMAELLEKNGRAPVYGIHFDEKAQAPRPESAPILDAIAALLRANPDLKLFVVGHTDNSGDFLGDLNLSKRRAALVVRDLVNNRGIDPGRLQPFGVGPLAPLAPNHDEKGRSLNRRIELVLQ